MDHLLKLYNSGQYRAVYNSLVNEQGNNQNKLIDQLLLSNNVHVCEILMRGTPAATNQEDGDFNSILKKCYSIPARDHCLVIELTVLYNYVYQQLVTQEHENIELCYSFIYKSCQRVLVCVSLGQRTKKSDVLKYQDIKTAAWVVIQDCLTLLQLNTVEPSLLGAFLQFIVLLATKEILNDDCAIVKSCLWDIKKCLSKGYVKVTTAKPEILLLRFPVYVDHVQLNIETNEDFMSVSSMLLSVCLSRDALWEEVVEILEISNGGCIRNVARFFKGFALFKMDKISDSISCLMEVLRSSDSMTQRLKARVCNLIGQCFLTFDKYHLSVEMFKEALCADFSFLLPLYNTSLQYRKQGSDRLELECLNLLVTALEMRNSSSKQENRVDLLSLINTEDEDVQYVFVLYSLAKRTLQLGRFDVACEKFLQLIDYMKSWKGVKVNSSGIPSLVHIHHEAIEALFRSEKYTECVKLCDKLLLCCHSDILNDTLLMSQTFDQSSFSQSQTNRNDSLAIEQSCTPRTIDHSWSNSQTGSQSGRKRKLSEITQSQAGDENHANVDVVALRYKAESMFKMGENTAALTCLQRAMDSISSRRRNRLVQCMNKTLDSVDEEPRQKKQKTGTASPSSESCTTKTNVVDILQDSMKSLELERILYEKTAEILTKLKKTKDAQHFIRLAEQIKFVENK